MPNPLVIDRHLHAYETREQALWGKDSYEIWEYGDKAEVHSSRFPLLSILKSQPLS